MDNRDSTNDDELFTQQQKETKESMGSSMSRLNLSALEKKEMVKQILNNTFMAESDDDVLQSQSRMKLLDEPRFLGHSIDAISYDEILNSDRLERELQNVLDRDHENLRCARYFLRKAAKLSPPRGLLSVSLGSSIADAFTVQEHFDGVCLEPARKARLHHIPKSPPRQVRKAPCRVAVESKDTASEQTLVLMERKQEASGGSLGDELREILVREQVQKRENELFWVDFVMDVIGVVVLGAFLAVMLMPCYLGSAKQDQMMVEWSEVELSMRELIPIRFTIEVMQIPPILQPLSCEIDTFFIVAANFTCKLMK